MNIERGGSRLARVGLSALLVMPGLQQFERLEGPDQPEAVEKEEDLPPLVKPGKTYETPIAGEGFWADVFGYRIEIQPDDRSSFSAWTSGLIFTPDVDEYEYVPYGALYFWRRPDDDHFLRATLVGVANELLYARSPEGWGSYETVFTFENYTPWWDWAESVDGERIDSEELLWGTIRTGVGVGWRQTAAPFANDNMISASLSIEPAYFYADAGKDTDDTYVVPEDTFETRLHLQLRRDALLRNVLELPHEGYSAGLDAVYGHRFDWDDWGHDGGESGAKGKDYGLLTGYAAIVGGVPGVDSERHRLLTTAYAGVGGDVDRFSSQRLGGGPQGDEYLSISRPMIPGAQLQEFFPEHYAIGIVEYRYEPIFFSYVGLVGSIAWLDRERERSSGIEREDNTLTSIGARMSTGFFGGSRLQLEYHYNFGLIRDGEYGGQALVFSLSGSF